ncbi:putative bifunctional diguanylate cyclase/phosphodiesterase [Ideonella sp. YS5]|uniref:putative bifunctional diguanylate cyclase/phosphodiesterase n=1 Tax=Ideonella sp. YS5 TaxID=3453714 RepID=UPI003EEFA585
MDPYQTGLDLGAHEAVLLGLCLLGALLSAGCAVLWRRALRRQGDLRAELAHATAALQQRGDRGERTGGMMSRCQFDRALDEAAKQAQGNPAGFSLLYLDLDNFREVNDAFGHDHGDRLLEHVASQLVACVGRRACRVVADEFALLVEGDLAAGHRAAERVASALSKPLALAQARVQLACSIGIAHYPEHGALPMLMPNAVLAMRSVKLAGGAAQAQYQAQMGEGAREQAALLQDLRQALERGQFELYYQPKVDARSLQVTAAEALLRWRHPERGVVSPVQFIPLAERYGLIGPIGLWVMEEACRQAAQWRELGLRMRVAVNISGYQMRQDDIVDRIQMALSGHRIPPGRFTCEITESVAMEDTEVTRRAFARLRAAGVHVSIDDFGTGYSSLASLRRLPAAELKIDRAFVCDLESSADARSIAEAIVQMAHTLGLRVVAEGVETEAQRDLLVAMGCDELQGYFFARPMTAKALELWATGDMPHEAHDFRPSLFGDTLPGEMDAMPSSPPPPRPRASSPARAR